MTTFYVDMAALQELANNLGAIYNALDNARDDFSYAGADMGSADVASALGDFSSGWKDGRKTIMDEIGSLMRAVQGAADDYLHNENQIKDASTSAGVSTSTGTGGPR